MSPAIRRPSPRVGGMVLCGGQSSRMGRPKAWLPIGSETMLARVCRVVASVVSPVVVVAAQGQELPMLPDGVEVVRDEVPDRGPLAGLVSGLTALQGRAGAVYLSSCDVPYLSAQFVRHMVESVAGHAAAVIRTREGLHPLAAVYTDAVLPFARAMLAAEELQLQQVFHRVLTRVVSPTALQAIDPELRSLRNINTPEEYEGVLRDFGEVR